jgi:hypothetical protein
MYLSEEHSFPSGNTWEISIQKKWLFDSWLFYSFAMWLGIHER